MENNSLLSKLNDLEARFQEVSTLITDPSVVADMKRYVRLNKEYRELEQILDARRRYINLLTTLAEAKDLLANESDPELREMAREEIDMCETEIPKTEEEIKLLLIPADPQDDKNAILEIRGGSGGDEAAIFAGDLFRMYSKYIETRGWRMEITNQAEGAAGGFKEIVVKVSGDGVYGVLKYESGVHRVQRVPETESQGRIQTSTVTVAVLPEAEDVDFELNPAELQIDVFRSSGAGGQKVNKTSSAIRVTHIPTGMVVECQDERSQHKNKDKALKVLRSRLLEIEQAKHDAEIAGQRKSQVGTGDRSERIRTYNFPQGRVSDHRIGLTLYKIEQIMNGDIDEIIDALITADTAEKLKANE